MKGELVGAGVSAEVFAWGSGRVVKLFRPEYRYAAEMEADRARAVHAAGVASPEVFELVEHEGRLGVVFERVEGELLLARLLRGAASPEEVGRRTAEIHVELHGRGGAGLPRLRALAEASLGRVPAEERAATRARHRAIPEGASIHHGDFHPGNVIEADAGPVLIDWVNACLAHPAADVARSVVLMRHQGLTLQTPSSVVEVRQRVTDAYLEHYLSVGSLTREEVDGCLPAMAAALLRAQPRNAAREELMRMAAKIR